MASSVLHVLFVNIPSYPILLLTAAILGLSSSAAYANEPYFQDCETAIQSRGFEGLKQYYARNNDAPRPSMCFKLNHDEFLVTTIDTGRVGQGLYYYDANNNSYELVDGRYCPNIDIKREFLGFGNKRYVLISCSNLHHGNWDVSYLLLYLVPGKKRQSFVFKELLFANEDPESGFCGSRTPDTATSIIDFHISGERRSNVRLEFTVEEEDCKTRARRKYVRAFQPRYGDFVEINSRKR